MEVPPDEFDVYLVSNGSMNLYPGNTLSSFTNLLSQPIYLKGSWSVALAEITFPTLAKNVPDTVIEKVQGIDWSVIEPEQWYDVPRTKYFLPGGFYKSVEEILNTVKGITKTQEFSYDVNQMRRVWVMVPENTAYLFSPPDVLSMCGFETNQLGSIRLLPVKTISHYSGDEENTNDLKHLATIVRAHGKDVATYPFDLSGGSNIMFVYTNIIEYQPVADKRAPLLRLIAMQHKIENDIMVEDESIHHKGFDNLQFKSLLTNTIAAIQIELRNEAGQLMPFVSRGRTAVTLRFKKNHFHSSN